MNTSDLGEELIKQLHSRKEGLTSDELTELTSNISAQERSDLINKIIQTGNVEMFQENGSNGFTLRYRESTLPAGATQEEHLVYSIIRDADNTGIWIRDIRDKTGLPEAQLRRILKQFEQRKLIKSVKAIGTTKKCYILFNVDADENLTGGAFYQDQQLDSQFVQTLVQFCVAMLHTKQTDSVNRFPNDRKSQLEFSYVKSEAVAQYIHERGISKIPLTIQDVESVLGIAVLDGKAEKRHDNSYRALNKRPFSSPLVSSPCFYCPMRSECEPGHKICPESCEYLKKYLEL